MAKTFDFIIVGAGTAGCPVAHKLSEAGHSVVVIEAGPQIYDEQVMTYAELPHLLSTDRLTKLQTTKQPHLEGREIVHMAGNLASGSSAVNFGNWTRCHSSNYDTIAELVKDDRWSYEGLLPYFKQMETHYDLEESSDIHGFNGPIHTTKAASRNYPLQREIHDAFRDAGIPETSDINNGNLLGFGPFVENWHNGMRQPAGKVFSLSKTHLLTEKTVKRLIVDQAEMKALGVELMTGEQMFASKEVLLCAGTVGSAKLLMLSGIGPASHLSSLGVSVIADLPVGENLHDHVGAILYWKLRHPERGLAVGHPNFSRPEYLHGNPIEWIAMMRAEQRSNKAHGPFKRSICAPEVEVFAAYAPLFGPTVFGDRFTDLLGTHISTPVLALKPRSRGSVRLASPDPSANMIIDPNYLSNGDEFAAFRTGFRYMFRAMLETASGRDMVVDETPPPDMPKLTIHSTDEEIDARVRRIAVSFWQLSGSASMGKVVDSQLRVYGIQCLRVIDASVFPIPLTGHYQCPVYVMAQLAADLILEAHPATTNMA